MVRHWLPSGRPGWRWKLAINGFGCALTAFVAVDRHCRQGTDVAPGRDRHPDPRRDDAVHPRQYRASAQQLAVRPDVVIRRPQREERVVVPVPGHQPGRRPGGQRRALDRRRRAGGAHLRRARGGGRDQGAVGAPAARRPARHRRVALPRARRADARVPRRPRSSLAARQAGADHVRRHARVRRPQLVGADPLQPVGEPTAQSPARSAHTVVVNVPYRREEPDAGSPSDDGPDGGDSTQVATARPTSSTRH